MAVYVGIKFVTVRSLAWPYKWASHLFADSIAELHEFASRLGLKRVWFQDHPRLPHYDVTSNKRTEAIHRGAIEVDRVTEASFYNGNCQDNGKDDVK